MHTNPLALFGDHLAQLRKSRGWSQEKLALESGLARSYVSGIERGRRNVALVNICVLADTLGVPTSEMLRFSAAANDAPLPRILPADDTPLPQIGRSLNRLDSRDQAWLADLIRCLSARLAHTPSDRHVTDDDDDDDDSVIDDEDVNDVTTRASVAEGRQAAPVDGTQATEHDLVAHRPTAHVDTADDDIEDNEDSEDSAAREAHADAQAIGALAALAAACGGGNATPGLVRGLHDDRKHHAGGRIARDVAHDANRHPGANDD